MSCEIDWSLSAKYNGKPLDEPLSERVFDLIQDSSILASDFWPRGQSDVDEDDWLCDFVTYYYSASDAVPDELKALTAEIPGLAFKLYTRCLEQDYEAIILIKGGETETLVAQTVYPDPVKIDY